MGEKGVFSPFRLNSLTLRNRVMRSSAFEGMCRNGEPTRELRDYHVEVARGGVAMTSVAYVSVNPEGRSYATQMVMREEIVPKLRGLCDAVHAEGAATCVQLGHCGYFSSREVTGRRPLGPSVVFNLYGLTFPQKMQRGDIEKVVEDFARAATLSKESGFDAIEIHVGHGYLLSQFLSPYTNRRDDRWGGSVENRARISVEVVRAVRKAVGPAYPILAKVNLRDGFQGGLEIEDAVVAARLLEEAGTDALVLSGGFVSKTPMYVMRGEVPFAEFYAGEKSLTKKLGIRLAGRFLVKEYPFTEGYFLEDAREVRKAVKLPLVLVGGLRRLSMMERVVREEGFELLAMARPLVMEPDLIRRMEKGETEASLCEPCNKCVGAMEQGAMRCLLLEERSKGSGGAGAPRPQAARS